MDVIYAIYWVIQAQLVPVETDHFTLEPMPIEQCEASAREIIEARIAEIEECGVAACHAILECEATDD